MTEPTTEAPPTDAATTGVTEEPPAHNRRKVYVDAETTNLR